MSLHPKVSTEMAREMVNTLVNIFQHCEGSGIVSVIRRQLQSTAFFLKGERKKSWNYWIVGLISVVRKMLESANTLK